MTARRATYYVFVIFIVTCLLMLICDFLDTHVSQHTLRLCVQVEAHLVLLVASVAVVRKMLVGHSVPARLIRPVLLSLLE